jgi:glycosyltransferase involved in cell wall biosynthesis
MAAMKDTVAQQETWIALLGRQDTPTDGVEDYCTFLGRALSAKGIELKQARVPWLDNGWIGGLRWLARESAAWRGKWVIVQYTALSWSRHGFPFLAVAVLAILRRGGARVAVTFHDPKRQGGSRWIDRLRGACQDWVLRKLYRGAAKNIFTVPLATVDWLPKNDANAVFIPIGGNIPECMARRSPPAADRQKTMIVFGVTGAPQMTSEVEEIAWVMREASTKLAKLRLVVVGRGALEAQEQLVNGLRGCDVEIAVRGVLPAEEIASEFARADVLLFLRGAITHQRGSAMAGIASGIPIVGYRGGNVSGPLAEAGIEWAPWQDRDGLVRGLVRLLSDPSRWLDLHERNVAAQKNWFSWGRIADLYRTVLAE